MSGWLHSKCNLPVCHSASVYFCDTLTAYVGDAVVQTEEVKFHRRSNILSQVGAGGLVLFHMLSGVHQFVHFICFSHCLAVFL